MKKLLLLGLMLLTAGCNASDEQTNIAQIKADIARKEAELQRAQESGGYRVVNPPVACANEVLYYITRTYGGGRSLFSSIQS